MTKSAITEAPPKDRSKSHLGGGGPSHPSKPGGGGDDFENRPPGRRGPRERLRSFRLGIGLALISIFIVFIGLTTAYVARRNGGTLDTETGQFISDWKPLNVPRILWLNTMVLLLSSISIEFARRRVFREPQATEEWLGMGTPARRASLTWIGITLALGLAFLTGQYIAWMELNDQGIFLSSNPSSSFFFILTGAHALHLIAGIIVLFWAALANLWAKPLESRQIATDIGAWYWHAMGALWIYIFVLLVWIK